MDSDFPFSREEILSGGLRGRRASFVLSLVEGRTAYLLTQVQWAIDILLKPNDETGQRNQQYQNVLYRHYRNDAVLTIADLERYAPHWASLVPPNPNIRVAVARLLVRKFKPVYRDIPAIRKALGLDTEAVQQAYQRRHKAPLSTLFTATAKDTPPAPETGENYLFDLEAAFEWVHLQKNNFLFHQGDAGDGLYVLVHGRLRVALGENENQKIINELSPGKIIGEIAIINNEPRTASIFAVRDSILLKLSQSSFERLVQRYPKILMQISRTLIEHIHSFMAGQASRNDTIITNLAVIPISPNVPLTEFCQRLAAALADQGEILHLSSSRLSDEMWTDTAQAALDDIAVLAWLSEQEVRYRFIIYEADASPSAWTERCIHQADHVLLVGQAEDNPDLSDIEKKLLAEDTVWAGIGKRLVLLHPKETQHPSGTNKWLQNRQIYQHHHIRWDTEVGINRLARFITGRAVGLVFGGGGVRGFAHIGIIKAIEALGLEVDLVGGASFGSMIAALYATQHNSLAISDLAQRFAQRKLALDYTLPFTSFFRGKKANNLLRQLFDDTQIEDSWRTFYCISTDLSHAKEVVHYTGPIWKYVRASMAMPAAFPPVIENGMVLMDGGIVNNVPLDVMRRLTGSGPVIGVDVSLDREFGDEYKPSTSLSGWKVLRSRLNPFTPSIKSPPLMQLVMRMSTLTSTRRRVDQRNLADLYICPPVERFGQMEAEAHAEIIDAGYQAGLKKIGAWLGKQR